MEFTYLESSYSEYFSFGGFHLYSFSYPISQSRALSANITASQNGIVYLLIALQLNSLSCVGSKLCWFFVLSEAAFEIRFFNVTITGLYKTSSVVLPGKVIKIKKWNSRAGLFPLTSFFFDVNNLWTNIDVNGGYLTSKPLRPLVRSTAEIFMSPRN